MGQKEGQSTWKELELSEVLEYEQPNKYIIKSPIIKKQTNIAVLTPGKSFIKGYTQEKDNIFTKLPIILFDDFTTSTKYVEFPFKVKSSALKILKPKNNSINLKFVFYQMSLKNINATTHKRYYISTYQKLKFLFPTDFEGRIRLNEQNRVVSEIEKQLTRLQSGTKSLRATKEKLEVYRKSILKHAFQEDWKYQKVGDLFETTSGGTPSRTKKSYYSGTIPWLKSGELNDNMNIIDSEEHITQDAVNNSSTKSFPKGTVLIALYGATTGKLGILRKVSTTNQAVCGILPTKGFLPEFVFYYLLYKRQVLIAKGKGGAQDNISQGIIRELEFPSVDKESQSQIVTKIEERFSVINKIDQAIENSRLSAEKLKKSILKSAFEGKLVKSID